MTERVNFSGASYGEIPHLILYYRSKKGAMTRTSTNMMIPGEEAAGKVEAICEEILSRISTG